jgi:hypothetical protein
MIFSQFIDWEENKRDLLISFLLQSVDSKQVLTVTSAKISHWILLVVVVNFIITLILLEQR